MRVVHKHHQQIFSDLDLAGRCKDMPMMVRFGDDGLTVGPYVIRDNGKRLLRISVDAAVAMLRARFQYPAGLLPRTMETIKRFGNKATFSEYNA